MFLILNFYISIGLLLGIRNLYLINQSDGLYITLMLGMVNSIKEEITKYDTEEYTYSIGWLSFQMDIIDRYPITSLAIGPLISIPIFLIYIISMLMDIICLQLSKFLRFINND